MTDSTVDGLVASIRASRILEPGDLGRIDDALRAGARDPRSLADELVRRDVLTPYQADRLLEHGGRGLILGPYLLLDCLGEGGMGRVYKARHRLMNRLVALKVIRAELLQRPAILERFRREILAAAQVSHPNLILAHDASLVDDTYILVLEYVAGRTLDALLDNGPLPIRQACDYARQAALGLEHVHERGLVHRDIKPSNLLVADRDGVVKILDLGLARLGPSAWPEDPDPSGPTEGALTQHGTIVGTPDYLAPEQALDPHAADIRSDLYSLGCTLYHLLTGRPPFPAGTLVETLRAHRQEPPVDLRRLRPGTPAGLVEVVARMLAKRPEGRYGRPIEVAEALRPYCGPAAPGLVLTPPPAPAPPTGPPTPPDAPGTPGSVYDLVASESAPGPGPEPEPAPRRPRPPKPPAPVEVIDLERVRPRRPRRRDPRAWREVALAGVIALATVLAIWGAAIGF